MADRFQFTPKRFCHIALDHAYRGNRGKFLTLCRHAFFDAYTKLYIEVPAGFRTDFASIPRVIWWLLDPQGPWARAALFHDWLYRTQRLSQEDADAIFRWIMEADGVRYGYRAAFYFALRLCGRRAWRINARWTLDGGKDFEADAALVQSDLAYGEPTP